ncbi:MAG: vanadium-dependent haloperoxidase [Chloroflexota bacterium]|nr:vanadium-dependent haloperoxidase [Chloroflexota bacterium]
MEEKMSANNSSPEVQNNQSVDLTTPFKMSLSRRTVLRTGAGLVVVGAGVGAFFGLQRGTSFAGGGGTITPNVAIQWNNAALQAIRDVSPGPTIGSRALAIMHTCMYDAWATYDPHAVPTRPNGIRRQKAPKDVSQAVSYAAYRAMMDLYPTEASVFTSLMQSLGYDPNNTSTNVSTQAGVGNVAAQAVLTFRHADGSNQLNGYADTTGYVPKNDPNLPLAQINPLYWQPLIVNGNAQKYTTPHWGTITPFGLTSGSQFRPAGPVRPSGSVQSDPAYTGQAATIVQYNVNLTDTTKTIADYWANGPHSETPPGHWELFAQFISAQYLSAKDKHALTDDVLLFFILSNAVFDAGIACWECKRYYEYVRPITAVRYLNMGQPLVCWGGPGQGTITRPDGANFIPYQESIVVTPPFPEYVSGHSTFSAASAYVMQQATGSDTFGNSFTEAPGSSQIEPGFAPSQSVTLSWPTFSAAAAEAGISRQYGGIHFNQGDQDGRVLGKQVATQVWTKAVSYIAGSGH